MVNAKQQEDDFLAQASLRLNAKILALAFGIILGLTLFLATNWLIIRGGQYTAGGEYIVGPHLQLLSQFFPGYRVSFLGSIIGCIYGFALGTAVGSAISVIYNKLAELRP